MEIVFMILAVIGIVIGLPTFIEWLVGRKYRHYFKVIWKKSSRMKPKDVLGEFRPYYEYYYKRTEDDQIRKAMGNKQNVLIAGAPLSGKTRAAYEALRNLNKPYDVLMPESKEIEPDAFRIPKRHIFNRILNNRQRIVFLDDLHNLVDQKHFDHLIREILKLKVPIIATCRSGVEQGKVNDKCSSKGIEVEMIFSDSVVEFEKVSEDVAKQVAEKAERPWEQVEFDGHIGSVFLPLKAMKDRYENCTDVEKTILRAMSKLYKFGIYFGEQVFPIEWIKIMAGKEGLDGKDYEWNGRFENLERKEFLIFEKRSVRSEEIYLERIISINVDINDVSIYNEMFEMFADISDALLLLGDRILQISRLSLDKSVMLKTALRAYLNAIRILESRKKDLLLASVYSRIGITYSILAELENVRENIKKAIEHYNKSLEIYTVDKFTVDYAGTCSNIGNSYKRLAEVEDTLGNCSKAIDYFKMAFSIFKSENYPEEYARTNMNLALVYNTLSEKENTIANCELSIESTEIALNFYNIDNSPDQYANSKNNLGIAYFTLAQAKDTILNGGKAIDAFNEALEVYKIDDYPLEYAMVQHNLGSVYGILANVSDTIENCKNAIAAYERSLTIRTEDDFPLQYAKTQNNLGLIYIKMARIEDKSENCRKAINAYDKALRIFTEEEYPEVHARIRSNLLRANRLCQG